MSTAVQINVRSGRDARSVHNRKWDKAGIAFVLAEADREGDKAVVARYGLSNSNLPNWRKAVASASAPAMAEVPHFPDLPSVPDGRSGVIEIDIAGVTIRVGSGVSASTTVALVKALRGSVLN